MTRLLALALLLGPADSARCAPLPRKVLALYSRERIAGAVKDVSYLQLHMRGELPLNYLGLEVVYRDAASALPDPAGLGEYRGIVTWFEGPVNFSDPERVCRFMSAAMERGLRVAVLGSPGLYESHGGGLRLPPACGEMFRRLGVELLGTRAADPAEVEIAHSSALMGFERKVDARDFEILPLARLLPGATAHLRLEFSEGLPAATEPVAVTPRGGLALHPFWLYSNRELSPHQFRWITDPFAFLEEALAVRGWPRPDPTTLSGRRLYMSHIDGDGFFNRSEIDPKKWSGEVFLREFIEKDADSPVTASLITGYYDLAIYKTEEALGLSRRLMSRPNVEPAAHSYTHPLVWSSGTLALRVPGYAFDGSREVLGSTEFIETRVLPPGRKSALFLWSGDCLPGAAELSLLERSGRLSMNGGGGRYDARFPSYAFLWPLSRPVGPWRQIYAPALNENEYTGLWTGPYYGYREAVESFERTGAPRRVKPVDVYVHFYSAEKHASLKTLRAVYDWARRQRLIPVHASRYVRAARAFFDMRVVRLGEGRFLFEGGADLGTVRFDAETRLPDLSASRGVIGWRRELGSLFVAFDEKSPRELTLSARPPRGPHLREANFEVTGWSARGGGVRFLRRGWWTGEFSLGGLFPGRAYRVRSAGYAATLKADAEGALRVGLPDSELGGPPREVLVEPAG